MQDMPKTIAHSKFEERPSVNTPVIERNRQTEERTHRWPAINHDITLKVGRSIKDLFRSVPQNTNSQYSAERNGTKEKRRDFFKRRRSSL